MIRLYLIACLTSFSALGVTKVQPLYRNSVGNSAVVSPTRDFLSANGLSLQGSDSNYISGTGTSINISTTLLTSSGTVSLPLIHFPDGSTMSTAISGSGVSSQWITNGSDIYYDLGNVGIGSTSPVGELSFYSPGISDALSVYMQNGDTGTSSTSGIRLLMDSSEDFNIINYSSKAIRFFTSGNERVTIFGAEDYLGIGSTNPNASLDILSSNGVAVKIVQDDNEDVVNIFDGLAEVFTIIDGGNVGIGSSAPEYLFDVYKTGDLGTAPYTASSIVVSNTNVDANDLTGLRVISSQGNTSDTGNIWGARVYAIQQSSANQTVGLYGYASASANDSYGLYGEGVTAGVYGTGASGVSGFGTTYGLVGTNNNAAGYGVYTNQGNSSGYAIYATGGRSYFSGNVGIGVSVPTQRLEVSGQISASQGISATGSPLGVYSFGSDYGVKGRSTGGVGYGLYGEAPTYTGVYGTGGAYGGFFQSTTGTGLLGQTNSSSAIAVRAQNLNSSGYSLYATGIGYFADNVGIGTTAPLSKLHVYRSTSQSTLLTGARVDTANTSTDSTDVIGLRVVSSHADQNNGANLYGVYSTASTVDDNGTVYGGYFGATNSVNQSIGVFGIGETYGLYSHNSTAGGFSLYAYQGSATGYGVFSTGGLNYFSGNTGIGTTLLTERLNISGNVSTSGNYITMNGSVSSTSLTTNSITVSQTLPAGISVTSKSTVANSYAGKFIHTGSSGAAVYGESTSSPTGTYGGYFKSATQAGLYSISSAPSGYGIHSVGSNWGLYAQSSGPAGYGLYAFNSSGGGILGYASQGFASANLGSVNAIQGGSGYAVYSSGGVNYFSGNVGIGTETINAKLTVSGVVSVSSNAYVNGNIGIGTTSPSGRLVVFAPGISGTPNMYLQNGDTGSTSTSGFSIYLDSSEETYIWNYHNDPIKFGTNNTERMRIAADGNVGIGTTSATSRLHLVGSMRVSPSAGITSSPPYFSSTTIIMRSPDGSCSSCGPNNSDVWACASIACP